MFVIFDKHFIRVTIDFFKGRCAAAPNPGQVDVVASSSPSPNRKCLLRSDVSNTSKWDAISAGVVFWGSILLEGL